MVTLSLTCNTVFVFTEAKVEDSILKSIKKALGLEPDYAPFDPELIMHINSVFTNLQQLAVGPAEAFMIEDDAATWTQFWGEKTPLNAVRTYVFMRVKLIWDTPATSFAIASLEKQIDEQLWRLNVQSEGTV